MTPAIIDAALYSLESASGWDVPNLHEHGIGIYPFHTVSTYRRGSFLDRAACRPFRAGAYRIEERTGRVH